MLAWIVFGLIGGLIGNLLMPERHPDGLIATVILGILGATGAGLLAAALGLGGVTGFDFRSFLVAVMGALTLKAGYRRLVRA